MRKFKEQITNLETYYSEMEVCKEELNIHAEDLSKCLSIVLDYIKRNNCVLVGGMAIDFALKNKGSFLYSTNKIDYDFISSKHHHDAYQLGSILAKQFDDITIIGARHISTMRVRYKFMPVADITYVPETIFDKVVKDKYEGLSIIHPHMQMLDQMRALAYISENPPNETYLSDRLSKDITRFNKLIEFYPVESSKAVDIMKQVTVPVELLQDNCLGGLAAAAYWAKKVSIDTKLDMQVDKEAVVLTIPENAKVAIFSDSVEKLLDKLNIEHKKYKPILDKLPERYEFDYKGVSYELYDNLGGQFVADKTSMFYFSGLFHTMLYLLTYKYFLGLDYEITTLLMNRLAEDLAQEANLFPTKVEIYGSENWSEAYLLAIRKMKEPGLSLLPRNFYPKKGEEVPKQLYEFDSTKSEILQRDGGPA